MVFGEMVYCCGEFGRDLVVVEVDGDNVGDVTCLMELGVDVGNLS